MERVAEVTAVYGPAARACVVVELSGELDVAAAPHVRRRLTALISDGCPRVVLDAACLDFIDAAGIGSLVHVANRAVAEGGWTRLVGVKPRHARLLMLLRLTGRLPMHESVEEACRDMVSQPE